NPEGAPGLECTLVGPALLAGADLTVCVTGAEVDVTVDGKRVPMWEPVAVPAGSTLDVGTAATLGLRSYVLVAGGLDVPPHSGSAATFTLGQFGGHGGRALAVGDVLRAGPEAVGAVGAVPPSARPALTHAWRIAVTEGPHAAPDFFTVADIDAFYAADWEVHFNSARTGVRLVGPKPQWTRTDGGEAGLHPSNIHDTPYSVGAVDFTGDVPIVLGPDGPSLGGFVCPATVVTAELWKVGQLAPGHTVRFRALTQAQAAVLGRAQDEALAITPAPQLSVGGFEPHDAAVLHREPAVQGGVEVVYRRAGDANVLIEFGELKLDLELRFQVHALMERLEQWRAQGRLPAVIDLTPGIRSLQVHFDPLRLSLPALMQTLLDAQHGLAAHDVEVRSRTVWLPLSWDDPATQLAIEKYMQSVRADAPWCPSNIEFIRRINGLPDVQAVYDIVYAASYLVLGLGDVYLGAPVATPMDPRHRLVTTKYNPARTWTPENAVGIGGASLCVYGMEGPGGYQFVGRTLQMWNRWRVTRDFEAGKPWLLRFFDRIRFYPVDAGELLALRRDFLTGKSALRIEEGVFRLSEYRRFLQDNAASIQSFKQAQQAAFEQERELWRAAGIAETADAPADAGAAPLAGDDLEGVVVASHVAGGVWSVLVKAGDQVEAGQTLVVVESMKMEVSVLAPQAGRVVRLLCADGQPVSAGQPLVLLREEPAQP
ncbi:MAG: urea carboxylase, partial [Frankiales bacterium]|nr:urea carboxylase [Frankiales bacterium]